MGANVIEKENDFFFCGFKTLQDWKAAVFFDSNEMELTEKHKRLKVDMSNGGHMLVKLEKIGEWSDEESINYLKEDNDIYGILL